MARRRAEIRQEEILRAAAAVVSRVGFARTRVADVAAELGVSTALVFYHFETKERLLSEAFLFAAEADMTRLDRAVSGSGPASARLRAVLRLYAPAGQAPGWTLDIEAWAEALHSSEIREASRRLDRRWRSAIETVIRDGVNAGEFDCPDPRTAAERIAAMLDGLGVATQVRRSVSRARAARWVFEYAASEVGVDVEALTRVTPANGRSRRDR
ncbi:MAG TPA: TetR family transcriptional regulator C-terminal domain-containing protein [Kineosporiaceae bacterium]|nr:TetR family transcriptional regulator C-terminal domain-containing protein [Kineosporiaceae bacterium]